MEKLLHILQSLALTYNKPDSGKEANVLLIKDWNAD